MTLAHTLSVAGATLAYDDRVVVDGLDLDVAAGRISVIVGPNACGKSTLLRAMARILTPRAGAVLLDSENLHGLPTRQVARVLGLLPQSPIAPEGIVVADLVARGRNPHQGILRRWSSGDDVAVAEALAATGTLDLAERCVDELSGGQRQRVWIAMALAQQTDLLLLDEPTTFLDITHQVDLLDLFAQRSQAGDTVIAVLHDINQAIRYADELIVMEAGRIVAQGPPSEVVSAALLGDVFSVNAQIHADPVTHGPMMVTVPSATV